MKDRRNTILFFLLPAFLFFQGCFIIPYFFESSVTKDWENPPHPTLFKPSRPFGYKKHRKKMMRPPISFIVALKNYRIERNSFPVNMTDFGYSSKSGNQAMKELKEEGFTRLRIKYWSLDSFRLGWDHPHIANVPTSRAKKNIEASGVFIFT